jgi:medium-chain acyl-[acyl-carrier-protein] hydrolase
LQEAPFTRLVPLVQTLARVLRPYLDIPFAFFGHSLGALISFELARQLRRQVDRSPARLLVAGCPAPQLSKRDPPIHQLPEALFVAELRRLNGTPELVLRDPDLLDLFLPLLRADFELYETYTYIAEAPLDCPVSVFGGLQDRRVDRGALAAWRDHTTADCGLRMLPGDHFFLESDRWLLLQAIAQDLAPLPGWMTGGHRTR